MALKISETDSDAAKDTGASFEYHRIVSILVDKDSLKFNVSIASYVDQAARDAGKVQISSSAEVITLDMDEDVGAFNLYEFMYAKLKTIARFTSAVDV